MPNTPIICPMCKSDAQTFHGVANEYNGWITACRCTKGRSRISASHSVQRWVLNVRKRYGRHAAAVCAGQKAKAPTIGRIVLYYPNQQEEADCGGNCGQDAFPAIIWRVKDSGCIDLAVFGMWGHTEYALNVPERSPEFPAGSWSWP